MTPARWLAVAALLVAVAFAWGGGTMSERSYRALRQEARADSLEEYQLKREVDSLEAYRDSLQNDPRTQILVARQLWGMVWPGEKSFLVSYDSAPVPAAGATSGVAAAKP